jgi:pimeloyl-ACP methyl ester carboxylesterase
MLKRKHVSALTAFVLTIVAFAQAFAGSDPRAESHALVNGVTLAYRVQGRSDGRPILLICGTGMQMVEWPQELTAGLIARGYRVITFDNRDSGHSTHFSAAGAPDWQAIFGAMAAGKAPSLPYLASNMVADTVALLDFLKIRTADVLGASGGATIAELVAMTHPDRVGSLTLLMANSGDPALPLPADPARAAAIPPPPLHESEDDQISRRMKTYKVLAGRGYPVDDQQVLTLSKLVTERDSETQGVARQGAALIVLGDLRTRLATIKAPTVVIHGNDDPLISPAAGKEVAEAIPGARFLLIKGMGHSLPAQAVGPVLEAMSAVGDKP